MTRTDKYYKAIQYYGIIPVLYVLQQCEHDENYKECKAILDAINDLNKYYSYMSYSHNKIQPLPSHISQIEPHEYVSKAMANFGINVPNYFEKLNGYIEEVKKYINQ